MVTKLKQLFAFTLAETLIVMGIIGVVAALTLPNLNSSTGEKEKVAKLQKIYSNLQDAFGRAEAVYGPYEEWFINDGNDYDKMTKRTFERITEFLKYSKICTITSCSATFDKNGSSSGDGRDTKYNVILADGATIGFSTYGDLESEILIDIDGLNKGSNKQCYDYFLIYITPKLGLSYSTNENSYCSAFCAAWILKNGNMDYLKTTYKNMIGGTCPDGKTVLNWTTNTTCK